MAEHSTTLRDYAKAITFYKEALVYNENDGKVCFSNIDQNHCDVVIIMLLWVKHCHIMAPITTVKILKFGTPQTIAIIVLKIEKFDVTLH